MTAGSQEHGLFVDLVQNAQNRWDALGHLPSFRGVGKVYLVLRTETLRILCSHLVDPAPGFTSLANDEELRRHKITIEIGRVKHENKNPVAVKCIAELIDELLRITPEGGPVSPLTLAIATANLNTRIRERGLSSREMRFQRDQFTNCQLPISDLDLIRQQHSHRIYNHPAREKSKTPRDQHPSAPTIQPHYPSRRPSIHHLRWVENSCPRSISCCFN